MTLKKTNASLRKAIREAIKSRYEQRKPINRDEIKARYSKKNPKLASMISDVVDG
jgi:hypothetical protein